MRWFAGLMAVAVLASAGFGQGAASTAGARSLEISEVDGLPVVIKHLPDYETVRQNAAFINDPQALYRALGDRPILRAIDFTGGTEGAFAAYPAGKLLIIEYTNPQSSVETDQKVLQAISQDPQNSPTAYRRIGNYNVFVFDGADHASASELIDKVRYEKTVQWLGEDPYNLQKVERYLAGTLRDVFVSTVQVIIFGILFAIVAGIAAGFIYFRIRDQRREMSAAFSDAGGLTRLNIDELTAEISPDQRIVV